MRSRNDDQVNLIEFPFSAGRAIHMGISHADGDPSVRVRIWHCRVWRQRQPPLCQRGSFDCCERRAERRTRRRQTAVSSSELALITPIEFRTNHLPIAELTIASYPSMGSRWRMWSMQQLCKCCVIVETRCL